MCRDTELALQLVSKEELRKEYLHRYAMVLPTMITLTYVRENNHLFLVCDCGDKIDLGEFQI